MILCFCRAVAGQEGEASRVSSKAVELHIQKKPQLLGQDWQAVSSDLTGCTMKCGGCEDAGNELIEQLRAEDEIASFTDSSCLRTSVPA